MEQRKSAEKAYETIRDTGENARRAQESSYRAAEGFRSII